MGTAYTPEQIKQLYSTVDPTETTYTSPLASTATSSTPSDLAMAMADVYGKTVQGGSDLANSANLAGYAHGGAIDHFDDGGLAFSQDQGSALQSGFKDFGKDIQQGYIQPAHPMVSQVGHMGNPYQVQPMHQYEPLTATPVHRPTESYGMTMHPNLDINPRLLALMQERGMSLPTPAAKGGLMRHDPKIEGISGLGSLAEGGNPAYKYQGAPEDHHPEFITGTTGHYVQGKGTGQSDDIPAMLADGEYVIDAETVSALGDGSNKAGAEVLNKMREAIRAHKRSAPLDKIPPKAKSPLDYMRSAMKGR